MPGIPAPMPAATENPRADLAADLAGHVTRLLGAGDLEGARLASDALARLLGSGEGAPPNTLADNAPKSTQARKRAKRPTAP